MNRALKKKLLETNKIIPIKNSEKLWHEKWYKGRNILNFPHPFRAIIVAKPNTGKSTIIKNIALRCQAQDPFYKCVLIHGNPHCTEYDDIKQYFEKFIIVNSIPNPKELKGKIKKKTLFIVDDYITKNSLSKEQEKFLSDIYSNLSTHDNVSILTTSQYLTNIPPSIRNLYNLFISSHAADREMSSIANYVDLPKDKYTNINRNILNGKGGHQTFWFDKTSGSPMKYRINGYFPLQ